MDKNMSYQNKRERNVEVFNDTVNVIEKFWKEIQYARNKVRKQNNLFRCGWSS